MRRGEREGWLCEGAQGSEREVVVLVFGAFFIPGLVEWA